VSNRHSTWRACSAQIVQKAPRSGVAHLSVHNQLTDKPTKNNWKQMRASEEHQEATEGKMGCQMHLGHRNPDFCGLFRQALFTDASFVVLTTTPTNPRSMYLM
jgi:hypothetical protein